MSLRFASLGSGSRGNALLVESGDTLIMIDCGLARRTVEERLRGLGREASDIAALLVTHEHSDHVQGIGAFMRRYAKPVWLSAGTACALPALQRRNLLSSRRTLAIGSITIRSYPVPHDAREPCQFVFSAGGRKLGLLTDSGHVTEHMRRSLSGCDALALEFNHDLGLLRTSPYPESVKARIASRFGHLSNAQSGELLRSAAHAGLQWVTGLHLSERNNTPERVGACFEAALDGTRCPLHLASQDEPTRWHEIV